HRHAFDVLEGAHDEVAVFGTRGCDAEPAVAHHDARDAVPARRGEVAVPEDLCVVVRVDVDEPGREHEAVEVDDFGPGRGGQVARGANRADAIAGDRDIGGSGPRAAA